MRELRLEEDNLMKNNDKLSREKVDAVIQKFHDHSKLVERQKLELEAIKLRADNYAEPFESVSKWITETDRVLVKAKPLAALPQLVEEQLTAIKVLSLLYDYTEYYC